MLGRAIVFVTVQTAHSPGQRPSNGRTIAWMRRSALVLLVSILFGCGASLLAAADQKGDYLRYVAFESPGHEYVLLRWPSRKMPLKVYAPKPPQGLFDEPEPIWEAARSGVLAWENAAGAGLPGFEFVDSAPEADIPIAWAGISPDVVVAHCFYDINIFQRRFGVAQIVVTGRFRDGRQATPELIHEVVTHEVGHALGLGGHSPNPEDLMHGFLDTQTGTPHAENTGRKLTARDHETLRLLYQRPLGAGVRGARRAY